MSILGSNPKTNIGALLVLGVIVLLAIHAIDVTVAISLLGIAGAWIGFSAKDDNK